MYTSIRKTVSQMLFILWGILGMSAIVIYYVFLQYSKFLDLGYLSFINESGFIIPATLILFNISFLVSFLLKLSKFETKRSKLKNFIASILVITVGSYISLCVFTYFNLEELINKNELIFIPTKGFQKITNEGVDELTITTSDHINLQGWLVKNSTEKKSPLIIFFGGSGMDVRGMVNYFKSLEGYSIAFFNYRGFGSSQGTPTQDNCVEDAKLIYDTLSKRSDIDNKKIISMGWSLGTCPAVYLSEKRPTKGTILVAPLDNVSDRFQSYFPYTPLSIVMNQSLNSISRAPNISTPLLCLIGDEDTTILPDLSINLAKKWKGATTIKRYKNCTHGLLFQKNSSLTDILDFINSLK